MKNILLQGDCLERLKELPDESVDLIVTDPPYAMIAGEFGKDKAKGGFMNKPWDADLPSIEVWEGCLRVLKPGAFAFVMCAPRSDLQAHMVLRLQEAGFSVRFTPLYHTFASGFPKAMNIGKMVDKRNGRNQDAYKSLGGYLADKITDSDAKCAKKVGFSPALVRFWKLGERVPNKATYTVLKSLYSLDDRFDELIEREEAEREVIGQQKNAMSGWNTDGSTKFVDRDITLAKTDQAKALDGSYGGFQPKPAVEVIIVAMKPLSEKTYVDQALKNGKGITWLGDCRVPTAENLNGGAYAEDASERHDGKENWRYERGKAGDFQQPTGRFPANLLVSDDVLNDHSRFFSLDEWAQTLPFLAVPKASKSEKNRGLDGFEEKGGGVYDDDNYIWEKNGDGTPRNKKVLPKANHHPTVKPLKLMSYLITLGSREGDLILDPFAGSGTTCLAAKELGRNYIGVEREEEYVKIAEARLQTVQPTLI